MPRRKAERAALGILKRAWADEDGMLTIPVDPVRIAERLGIEVVNKPLEDSVSGAIVKEPTKSRPVIYLDSSEHPNRQRFTCAHELGHFAAREGDREFAYIDERGPRASLGVDAEEMFANAFAAELLMPAIAVRELSREHRTTHGLAITFGVSSEAMEYRLDNLKLRPGL